MCYRSDEEKIYVDESGVARLVTLWCGWWKIICQNKIDMFADQVSNSLNVVVALWDARLANFNYNVFTYIDIYRVIPRQVSENSSRPSQIFVKFSGLNSHLSLMSASKFQTDVSSVYFWLSLQINKFQQSVSNQIRLIK